MGAAREWREANGCQGVAGEGVTGGARLEGPGAQSAKQHSIHTWRGQWTSISCATMRQRGSETARRAGGQAARQRGSRATR